MKPKTLRRIALISVPALALVIAANLFFVLSRPKGDALYRTLHIEPLLSDAAGVDPESAFSVGTEYRADEETLRAALTFAPPFDYALEGGGKGWTLTPGAPLRENTVYSVRVRTPGGEDVRSFAFQTRTDLAVDSTFPRDGEQYVDLDTGVEIVFNAPGIDVRDAIKITPEIPGRFESGEYAAKFIPDAPLETDCIYRFTLPAGLKAPDGRALGEEYTFSFQTRSDEKNGVPRGLELSGPFSVSVPPGAMPDVPLSSDRELDGVAFDVTLHRYPDREPYIAELRAYEKDIRERSGKPLPYVADTAGLEEVAVFHGGLIKEGDSWYDCGAPLPELPEGCYVATVSGSDPSGAALLVQQLIQVSSLSVYTQSVDGETLFWLNDSASGGPVSGARVSVEDMGGVTLCEASTAEDGTATAAAPFEGKRGETAYLRVRDGEKSVYFDTLPLSTKEEALSLEKQFQSGIYTDRAIYQPTDTVHFWGVVSPRAEDTPVPSQVWAALSGSGSGNGLYRQAIAVQPDGTFDGKLAFEGLRMGYYTLCISDGGESNYLTSGISVEEYTKPPYIISVSHKKEWYYADEPVDFQISAVYYDGTPVAGGVLNLSSYNIADLRENGRELTLDETGSVSFSGMYQKDQDTTSWMPAGIWYNVAAADAEDMYINANGSVQVLPSRVALELVPGPGGNSVTVRAATIEESRIMEQDDTIRAYHSAFQRYTAAPADIPITLTINKSERVGTPDGTYYDYVNKKNVTKYNYTNRESVAGTRSVATAGGVAQAENLPVTADGEDVSYRVVATFDGGVIGTVSEVLYLGRSSPSQRVKEYTFAEDKWQKDTLPIGGKIELALYEDRKRTANKGRVLYSAVQTGVLSTGIFTDDTQEVLFGEAYLPNVRFAGAYFDGRSTHAIKPYDVSYDYQDKTLSVSVEAESGSYRPSDKAAATIRLTDASGAPVKGTVCVGVVDESVFALAEQDLDLASQLYKPIYYPEIIQKVNASAYESGYKTNEGTGGGAMEASLAGGEPPLRKLFIDTALFQTLETDASGTARAEWTLPDNITAWRITAAAVTGDLKAGSATGKTSATLPFYVRPLITGTYREGDDAGIALKAVAAQTGDDVRYAATLTPKGGGAPVRLEAQGVTGAQTALNFGKLPQGEYDIKITAESGAAADAVQRTFTVAPRGLPVERLETMALPELAALESERYPVDVTLYDKRCEPYMAGLRALAAQGGQRTEIIAASYRARLLQNALLKEGERPVVPRDTLLDIIQTDHESGGVRPLPFAGPDTALTAKMLIAAPELVDTEMARTYLRGRLTDASAPPNDRAMAAVGLAALRDPMLLDLQRMVGETPPGGETRPYLATGLALLGDTDAASAVYAEEAPIGGGEAREGALLLLASVLAHPDADARMLALCETVGHPDESRETPVHLEMLAYLNRFPLEGESSAKVRYTLEGGQREEAVGPEGVKTLSLSREALEQADFEAVDGEAGALVRYTGKAADKPDGKTGGITVEKTVTPLDGGAPRVPKMARVTLKLHFPADAPTGTYRVSDRIPSGMRFIDPPAGNKGSAFDNTKGVWGRITNEGQSMYGAVCIADPDVMPIARDGDKTFRASVRPNPAAEAAFSTEGKSPPNPGTDAAEEDDLPSSSFIATPSGIIYPDVAAEESPPKDNPGTDDAVDSDEKIPPSTPAAPEKINPDTSPEDEPTSTPPNPNGDGTGADGGRSYTLTYFVCCVIPGEYVLEGAYVEKTDAELAVHSEDSTLIIA